MVDLGLIVLDDGVTHQVRSTSVFESRRGLGSLE
jgi:hypothetical protein